MLIFKHRNFSWPTFDSVTGITALLSHTNQKNSVAFFYAFQPPPTCVFCSYKAAFSGIKLREASQYFQVLPEFPNILDIENMSTKKLKESITQC